MRPDYKLRKEVSQGIGPCHLCGGWWLELPGETWVADHILPTSRGGLSTIENLAKAHSTCNGWRGSKLLSPALLAQIAKRRRLELRLLE